ncbi:HNH endonuclease [Paenibacillus sp. Marseille-Q4541]|uniref:HNH endonuclease n=1 Tax=Paenibacillus sp. Marseille-Q4541 TaxID=2831522 RepID=UPI001BAAE33E|nr:HNH endonuclease [Paenibacillus sp. Marseille-Q4541]
MQSQNEERICELCKRKVPVTTVHHLTPREEGGTDMPTAHLCIPCHKQIHYLFTNVELVVLGLTTIKSLLLEPTIASYVKWIRKQPAATIPKSRKSRHVREARR